MPRNGSRSPLPGGARKVARLCVEHLAGLPGGCGDCLFWELDPVRRARLDPAERLAAKQAWVEDLLSSWGPCGQVALVDGAPVGYVLYAPQPYVPGAAGFATAPISPDAVLLTALRVAPTHAGGGLGRMLVQAMARDLTERADVAAVEAFGATGPGVRAGDLLGGSCAVPARFLDAVGFRTQRAHPLTPRLRMDLRAALSWRDEVEAAIDRLVSAVRPAPKSARPSPPTRTG